MAVRVFRIWLCFALFVGHARAADDHERALAAVLAQHCAADVLFLGEDSSHGSGAAFAFKTALVPRLVAQCGYDTLVFESGLYEFLALPDKPSPSQLADAIGGLWSTTAELDPLLDFLVKAVADQGLSVHGMDPQLGGATQGWTQAQLAASVVAGLPAVRRQACQAELERLLRWQYNDAQPYDLATEQRLAGCGNDLAELEQPASAPLPAAATPLQVARRRLAAGLQLARADGGPKGLRVQSMAEHLRWLLKRDGRADQARRILVWTANAHATREQAATVAARLADDAGLDVHSLTFHAAGGTRQRIRSVVEAVVTAEPDSREARLLAESDVKVVYAPAAQPEGDALIIFRTDRPPTFVHPPRPRDHSKKLPLPHAAP